MLYHIRSFIRDIVGDLLYASGITNPSYAADGYFSVITFHRVLPEAQLKSYPMAGIAITPDELTWFMNFFLQHFICGPLSESLARWSTGEKTKHPLLAITFDDGQLDNFLYAKPVLDKFGVRASFFVVVDGIEHNDILWYNRFAYAILRFYEQDAKAVHELLHEFNLVTTETPHNIAINLVEQLKTLTSEERLAWVKRIENAIGGAVRPNWEGMMNWAQLRKLAHDGHEIGSHSMSHPILPFCSDTELIYEVENSRRVIQEHLNIPVESFCYPNGDYDKRILKAVQQAGYHQAVTTQWGQNQAEVSPFMLQRCDIQSQHTCSRKGSLSTSRLAWRLSRFYPRLH